MKTSFYYTRIIFLALILVLTIGCKKDDESSSSPGGMTGGDEFGFEAMVDGNLVQIPILEVNASLIPGASNIPDYFELAVEGGPSGTSQNFLVRQIGYSLTIEDIQTGPLRILRWPII